MLVPPTTTPPPSQSEDPLETKGLDELIKFINGTEEDDKKPLSAKAAKRARQKQRKVNKSKVKKYWFYIYSPSIVSIYCV